MSNLRLHISDFSDVPDINTPPGAPQLLTFDLPDLILSAILVGYRATAGSAYHRILRDASIDRLVRSSLETDRNGNWVTTEIFRGLETTEKSGASFRLGMMFAQLVAEETLGTLWLKHYAKSHGRRADLVGVDATKPLVGPRPVHVIEAKARSDRAKRISALDEGKDQVTETSKELLVAGEVVSRAAVSVAVLDGGPIEVFLKDPPTNDDELSPRPEIWAERLRDFYSPILDLLDYAGARQSGVEEIDEKFDGNFLPGSSTWIGIRRELVSSRDEYSLETTEKLVGDFPEEDSSPGIERFNGVVREDGVVLLDFESGDAESPVSVDQ